MRNIFIILLLLIPSIAFPSQDQLRSIIAKRNTSEGAGYTVSYVSSTSASNSGSSSTDLTIDVPTGGDTDGRMMILTIADENDVGVTIAGWTAVTSETPLVSGGYTYYRETSSEPSSYTIVFPAASEGHVASITLFSKDGGTWVAPTTAGYSASATDTSTGVDVGPINIPNGSYLVGLFTNDGPTTVVTPPSAMTEIYATGSGSMIGASYYQEYASAASSVSKGITFGLSTTTTSHLIVVSAN
jgi:hypothetical protein